ncbi:MAG: hypothetical protein HY348_05580, partial [Nitrospira defluvii]|nr:hypothetical protein [Nitrospira defluvii]
MRNKKEAKGGPSRLALTAVVIPLALGLGIAGMGLADELPYEPDVVLVMKDKAFHVIKGAQPGNPLPNPAFSLPVGMDLVVLLRNEDEVAHEFVSPLLMKVEDLQLSGRATLVYTHTAVGVRVEPRDSVLLRFDIPEAGYDQFHFWCNIHGGFLMTPCEGRSLSCMRNNPPRNRTSGLLDLARIIHECRREAFETEARRGFSHVRPTEAYLQSVEEAEREKPRRARGSD